MASRKSPRPTFEKALLSLESIVEKMETGELGLEDSLKLFEEGVGLSRLCQERLIDVGRRVDEILENHKGELETRPLDSTHAKQD